MSYVTLDTGLKGAMVLFDNDGVPAAGLRFKKTKMGIDIFEVQSALRVWSPNKIYIERVMGRPRQSSTATFTQGIVFGQLSAIASVWCAHVEYIWAVQWTGFTKRLSVDPTQESKVIAQELVEKHYPRFADNYRGKINKKCHDGIADCLCINIYLERDKYLDNL